MKRFPALYLQVDLEMSHWSSDGPGALNRFTPEQQDLAMAWAELQWEGYRSLSPARSFDAARLLEFGHGLLKAYWVPVVNGFWIRLSGIIAWATGDKSAKLTPFFQDPEAETRTAPTQRPALRPIPDGVDVNPKDIGVIYLPRRRD